MAKPERNFINRIHRKLDPDLHKQAMGLTSTNGTPDYYYEGFYGYLWIEYKWYPKEPEVIELYNTAVDPHLSALQLQWCNRAHKNGANIMVVAGYPKGCIVLPDGTWNCPMSDAGGKIPYIMGWNEHTRKPIIKNLVLSLRQYKHPESYLVELLNELERGKSNRT